MDRHKKYRLGDMLQYVLNGESDFSDDDDTDVEPDNILPESDVDTNGEDVVEHNELGDGVIFDT